MHNKNAAVSVIVGTEKCEVPPKMIDSHAGGHLLRYCAEVFTDRGDRIVELNSETLQAIGRSRRFIEENTQIALHADGWVVLTMQAQNRFDAAEAVILVK